MRAHTTAYNRFTSHEINKLVDSSTSDASLTYNLAFPIAGAVFLSRTHTLPLPHLLSLRALSFSLSLSLSVSLCLSLSLSFFLSLPLSLPLSFFLSLCLSLSLSFSLNLSLSPFLYLSLSHSLSLSLSLFLCLSPFLSLSLSLSHTHTHALSLSFSFSFSLIPRREDVKMCLCMYVRATLHLWLLVYINIHARHKRNCTNLINWRKIW